MRKIIFNASPQPKADNLIPDNNLNLEQIATVLISSEAADFPIENAFTNDTPSGWKAGTPGIQTIRLVFDELIDVSRIILVFEEKLNQRTQEFTLKWSCDNDVFNEIVRQQYHFSPPDTITEIEDYRVKLSAIKSLELILTPDISNRDMIANLLKLHVY